MVVTVAAQHLVDGPVEWVDVERDGVLASVFGAVVPVVEWQAESVQFVEVDGRRDGGHDGVIACVAVGESECGLCPETDSGKGQARGSGVPFGFQPTGHDLMQPFEWCSVGDRVRVVQPPAAAGNRTGGSQPGMFE